MRLKISLETWFDREGEVGWESTTNIQNNWWVQWTETLFPEHLCLLMSRLSSSRALCVKWGSLRRWMNPRLQTIYPQDTRDLQRDIEASSVKCKILKEDAPFVPLNTPSVLDAQLRRRRAFLVFLDVGIKTWQPPSRFRLWLAVTRSAAVRCVSVTLSWSAARVRQQALAAAGGASWPPPRLSAFFLHQEPPLCIHSCSFSCVFI